MNNKAERRKARHLRNKESDTRHKKEAWINGKVILEYNNGEDFSPTFTVELRDRLYYYVKEQRSKAKDPYEFLRSFQQYKSKIIQLILKYNPDVEQEGKYQFLKKSLETYWDEVLPEQNPLPLWLMTTH